MTVQAVAAASTMGGIAFLGLLAACAFPIGVFALRGHTWHTHRLGRYCLQQRMREKQEDEDLTSVHVVSLCRVLSTGRG